MTRGLGSISLGTDDRRCASPNACECMSPSDSPCSHGGISPLASTSCLIVGGERGFEESAGRDEAYTWKMFRDRKFPRSSRTPGELGGSKRSRYSQLENIVRYTGPVQVK